MSLPPFYEYVHSVFETYGCVVWSKFHILENEDIIYPHQAEAVRAIKHQLENQPPGHEELENVSLAVLPTGTGKTGVGILVAYACRAHRVLIITPSEAISRQWMTQFKTVRKRENPFNNEPFFLCRNIVNEVDRSNSKVWAPKNSMCVLKKGELETSLEENCELVITNAHKFGEEYGKKGFPINKYASDYFSLVIVDEAHHFPAPTWDRIVKHFNEATLGILFLTATPQHRDKYIFSLQKSIMIKQPCYEYPIQKAIKDGVIRKTDFIEVDENISESRDGKILAVLEKVEETLRNHDELDDRKPHKAMVLAMNKEEAKRIAQLWNENIAFGECKTFVESDPPDIVESFKMNDETKVLVIIYRLTEGFDYKQVSVVAILRNVGKKSRVYFAQFVGRAVRKLHRDDPVTATVISHVAHKQRTNYDAFVPDTLPDEDPEEPEDEPQEE